MYANFGQTPGQGPPVQQPQDFPQAGQPQSQHHGSAHGSSHGSRGKPSGRGRGGRGGHSGGRVCSFFMTPQGCQKGPACTFAHTKPQDIGGQSSQQFQGQQQDQQHMQGGFPGGHDSQQQQQQQLPYSGQRQVSQQQQPFSQKKTGSKPCKFGPTCKFLAQGTCSFGHDTPGMPLQTPGAFQQQQQPQQQQQLQGHSQGGNVHQQSQDRCNFLDKGHCYRIKCMKKHIFRNEDFSLKVSHQVIEKGESILATCLVKGGQSLIFVTLNKVVMLGLPSLQEMGSFPTNGMVSAVKTFDNVPDTIFFGIQSANAQGVLTWNIKVVLQTQEIKAEDAHSQQITAFEYAKINNEEVIFSAGLDMKLKAWKVVNGTQLQCILTKDLNSGVTSLQMTSDTLLVAGLQNGTFQGWNLSANSFTELQAHQSPVNCLHLHNQFLVSGDAGATVFVRDTTSFEPVLQHTIQYAQSQTHSMTPQAVTSLTVLDKPQEAPVIIAGDANGEISLICHDPQTQQTQRVTFGAHNDYKGNAKRLGAIARVFLLPGTQDLCSLDVGGNIKLWTQFASPQAQ